MRGKKEEMLDIFEEHDKKYCYPNSDVLKNKLNIEDSNFLVQAERRLVALRMAELFKKPIKGNFILNI